MKNQECNVGTEICSLPWTLWGRALFGFDSVSNGGTKETRVLEGWWWSIQCSIFTDRESRGDQRSSLKRHFWTNREWGRSIVPNWILCERMWAYINICTREGVEKVIFGQEKTGPHRDHLKSVDNIIVQKASGNIIVEDPM